MKKILLATAAAMTMGLSIATASAASAGVTPSPVPTQFGGTNHTCEAVPFDGSSPTVSPQFGRNCDPRPVPVQQNCARQIRIVPRDVPSPEPTYALSAKITHHDDPSPAPSQQFGLNPRPRPVQLRCRPEHFDIAQAWTGPRLGVVIANYAQAIGPVNGVGTDTQLSNTLDRLNLGSGRVFLQHNGIGNPIVNLNNCTASLLQFGLWRFNGGTGLNLHAVGNGTYRLALLAHFPVRGNVCSLSLISGNPLLSHRIGPDFLSVGVHGDGLARR